MTRDDFDSFCRSLKGTTHVVQQQLPLTPPISIGSLSNAMLGGFSLSSEAPHAGYLGLRSPPGTDGRRRVTALGYGGLRPHILQAIGNSYANPYIPADAAISTWQRTPYSGSATFNDPYADQE